MQATAAKIGYLWCKDNELMRMSAVGRPSQLDPWNADMLLHYGSVIREVTVRVHERHSTHMHSAVAKYIHSEFVAS